VRAPLARVYALQRAPRERAEPYRATRVSPPGACLALRRASPTRPGRVTPDCAGAACIRPGRRATQPPRANKDSSASPRHARGPRARATASFHDDPVLWARAQRIADGVTEKFFDFVRVSIGQIDAADIEPFLGRTKCLPRLKERGLVALVAVREERDAPAVGSEVSQSA